MLCVVCGVMFGVGCLLHVACCVVVYGWLCVVCCVVCVVCCLMRGDCRLLCVLLVGYSLLCVAC